MQLNDANSQENLAKRLHRIEGQMRGIASMMEEGRDCREILQQLQSAKSALQGVTKVFLEYYAGMCLKESEKGNAENRGALLKELLDTFTKYG